MAPPRTRTRAKPAVEPEPEVTEDAVADSGLRPVGALHEHMADWLNSEYGDELDGDLTARMVQVVISKRNEYRKSGEYAEFAAEREEERASRDEEKAARVKAPKAAPAEDAEDEAPAKSPRRRRGAAATEEAAPAKAAAAAKPRARRGAAVAKDADETPKAPPARRSRRRGAATVTEESEADPF